MRKTGRNSHSMRNLVWGFKSQFLIESEAVILCVLSSLHIVPKVELDLKIYYFYSLSFMAHTLLEQCQCKNRAIAGLYVTLQLSTC